MTPQDLLAEQSHGGARESAILPGYDDLIVVLETLPLLIRETRRRKRLSMRATADTLGVSASTLMRWERGETVGLGADGIVAVLRWVAE